MRIYFCQKCGQKFEAVQKRKFCSQECRSRARVNYYFVYSIESYERIISIEAPKDGWVINTCHRVYLPNMVQTVEVRVDGRGKMSHKLHRGEYFPVFVSARRTRPDKKSR